MNSKDNPGSFRYNRIAGSPRRWRKRLIQGLVTLAIMVVIGLGVIRFYPDVAANLADSVLRPVIGDNATIALEAFFFAANDQLKQLVFSTGGKPSANIFNQTVAASTHVRATPTPLATPKGPPPIPPLDLSPIAPISVAFAPLAGEGAWSQIVVPQLPGQTVMARTFVRPDAARSYAIASLVKLDMHKLALHAVAGTQQPGGPIGHGGTGVIPSADQTGGELVAAFNGGFQYKDGRYGMVIGPKIYVPLLPDLATLSIYHNGKVEIGPSVDTTQGPVDAVRQNGPLIIDHGVVTPDTADGGMLRWGLTVTNSMYTWRSGVGVTASGNLVYAVGPSLTAHTLAVALKSAGAVNAMQLDINPYWVRFILFDPAAKGGYTYESLLKNMQNGGYNYLHGYQKDFFYLTVAQAKL